MDNLFIDNVLEGLRHVQKPYSTYHMTPLPVSLIAPIFHREYFSYMGSLTDKPYTKGIRWIIPSKPLKMSSRQICRFRGLKGFRGYIESNTRPVQNSSSRDVFFYK